jgi:aminoglycoside 6'-N-acetyltransferase
MPEAISFRSLQRGDFAMLRRWLNTPRVYEWWGSEATQWGLGGPGERAASLRDVEESFGPGVDGAEPVHYFVIEANVKPIGIIQAYLIADHLDYAEAIGETERDVAGIDLAIGDPAAIGRGLGPRVIDKFVRSVIFARPETRRVIGAPDHRNARSIRAFEKAGFRFLRDVPIPGEPAPHRLMLRLR